MDGVDDYELRAERQFQRRKEERDNGLCDCGLCRSKNEVEPFDDLKILYSRPSESFFNPLAHEQSK